MTSTTPGFVGPRLTEARRARGISATDLAGMVGVSVQSISKYENGHPTPKLDVFHTISSALKMPRPYFLRPLAPEDDRPVFWRGKLSAPPVMSERAGVRLEWLKEVVDYIAGRSEEHTSELQSLMRISYAVFCFKTKNTNKTKAKR